MGAIERCSAGEEYNQIHTFAQPTAALVALLSTSEMVLTPRRALFCPGEPDAGDGVLSVRLGSHNKQRPPLSRRRPQRSLLTCVTRPLQARWGQTCSVPTPGRVLKAQHPLGFACFQSSGGGSLCGSQVVPVISAHNSLAKLVMWFGPTSKEDGWDVPYDCVPEMWESQQELGTDTTGQQRG